MTRAPASWSNPARESGLPSCRIPKRSLQTKSQLAKSATTSPQSGRFVVGGGFNWGHPTNDSLPSGNSRYIAQLLATVATTNIIQQLLTNLKTVWNFGNVWIFGGSMATSRQSRGNSMVASGEHHGNGMGNMVVTWQRDGNNMSRTWHRHQSNGMSTTAFGVVALQDRLSRTSLELNWVFSPR